MTNPPVVSVLAYYGWDGRQWGYGEWVTVRCPFHGDTHASGRLNEAEGVFKCHACGMGGNAVKLIELKEGIGYEAAKARAKELTGVEHDGSGSRESSPRSKLPLWTRNRPSSDRRPGRRLSGSSPRRG